MNTTVHVYLIAMAIYIASPENNYNYVIFSMVDILGVYREGQKEQL